MLFEYCSRSYQHHISHDDCMELAEGVVDVLCSSPVLSDPLIAVTRVEHLHVLDIKASLDCLQGDKLSMHLALAAADEQVADALRECDGETDIHRSMIRPFTPRV